MHLALLWAQQVAANPSSTATQLVPWGGLTAAVGLFTAMLRLLVASERRRADDWRTAAQSHERRADERDRQIWTMLAAVKDKADAA